MVELVNRLTGGRMWVDESRLDEYLAAGHRLAASPAPAPAPPELKKPRKTAKRK